MRPFLARSIFTTALCLGLNLAVAQHWLGLTPSNYAGLNAVFQQPAQVADSRYRLFVSALGGDVHAYNNYVRWAAPYPMWRLGLGRMPAQFYDAQGGLRFGPGNLAEQLDGRTKKAFAGGELRGPGLLVASRDGRWGVGITSRVRVGASVVNTTENLAQLIRVGFPGSGALPVPPVTAQHSTVNVGSFGELGLTLGRVLRDNDQQFWKVGASVKRLVGLYNVHLAVQNTDYQLIADPAVPGLTSLAIQQVTGSYGYTTEAAYKSPQGSWLLGPSAPGAGWGFDVGVVYEFRPDARLYRYNEAGEQRLDGSRNKYQYRVSASLTDVGLVQYRNPAYVAQYERISGLDRALTQNSFNNIQNADQFFGRVGDVLGVDDARRQTAFRSVLPTALNLSVDYKIGENFYVNGTWVQPLLRPSAVGLYRPAVLAVVPRYELPRAELSLPVSWQGNYTNLAVGLALRLGPVVLGTDHLPGLLNAGRPRGANIYVSTAFSLLRPSPRDPLACYTPGTTPTGRKRGLFRR